MPRPLIAIVKPQAIASNLKQLLQYAPQSTPMQRPWHIMAVVKANAYGHRLPFVLPGLQLADSLAVLELERAIELRNLGWTKPIVLLEGCFEPSDFEVAAQYRLSMVLHHPEQLQQLFAHHAQPAYTPSANVAQVDANLGPQYWYFKVNTGMNRLGFDMHRAKTHWHELHAWCKNQQFPEPIVMTHFANADAHVHDGTTITPKAQFDALQSLNLNAQCSSLANSAGMLHYPQYAGQVVRPGIALYGASPSQHPAAHYGLQPAMVLRTKVIAMQTVQKGESVGYGSRFIAKRTSQIAVVACGYADGYPRHAPDGTPMWVGNQRCPLAGRVSMDMMTVDVTDAPQVQLGSEVELWGEHLPVDEVASHSGTIAYELLCALAPRVPVVIDQP